jgi:polar amino acid transport system substrate-binding protein
VSMLPGTGKRRLDVQDERRRPMGNLLVPLVRAAWVAVAIFTFASGCARAPKSQSTAPAAPLDLLAKVQQQGKLIVATDPNFKPQSYLNANGVWSGFDVAVGREIARRLGVRAVFAKSDFNVVALGNWHDRWDINVGSMTITQDRTKHLWFTSPYYYDPASFAVHRNSKAHSIAELSGSKIGVSAASTYLAFLQGKIPTARIAAPSRIQIVQYDTDVPALKALALGPGVKVDAVLTSLSAIREAIGEGMPLRVIEPAAYEESLAIDLDKASTVDSRPLLWAIGTILQQMHDDGTLHRLSLLYFGVDLSVRSPRFSP